MGKPNERDVAEAIDLVRNGEKPVRAARAFGIPKSTLSNRLHGAQPHSSAHNAAKNLSDYEEQELEEWILHEELCGRAASRAMVRSIAAEMMRGIASVEDATTPGVNWVTKFIRRHTLED